MTNPWTIGRLNGITGEPGTILGPDGTGRYFAVDGCDDQGVTVRFASREDLDVAPRTGQPARSVIEHRNVRQLHPLTGRSL